MHNSSNNLLFSIDKEITNPSSCAGKVWRILIISGTLHVGDIIRITSVNLAGRIKSDYSDIGAEVKSIHEELDAIEGVKEINASSIGSIVGVDIKNCYCGSKRIHKKEIKISKQSIGFSYDEPFDKYSCLYFRFSVADEAISVIGTGQNVIILWFGKAVAAKVTKISESLEGMYISLLAGRVLAIPRSYCLIDEVTKKTKLFTYYKGQMQIIAGLFEFEKTP